MSVNWIQMRTLLADDPRTLRIANLLKINEDEVVGKLHKIWSWATDHLTNGKADGVTVDWIDRHMRCPGWADAMLTVGWLKATKKGLLFPEWDRFLSNGAKTRALTARRVGKTRTERYKCNGASVTKALPEKEKEKEKEKEEEREPEAAANCLVNFGMGRKAASRIGRLLGTKEALAATDWAQTAGKGAGAIVAIVTAGDPFPWREGPAKASRDAGWSPAEIKANVLRMANQ